ncbi:MAG TPA: hypothetical protein VGD67_29160, partial [Pseudonocardiaceae bacterium]
RGARRIAVASWFLGPGRLTDRIAAAAADAGAVLAEPLGADPDLAQVVLDRFDAACDVRGGYRHEAGHRASVPS